MDKPKRRFSLLLALAAGVTLALLIIPATRWIVRSQLRMQFTRNDGMAQSLRDLGVKEVSGPLSDSSDALEAGARRNADDVKVQIARALAMPAPNDGASFTYAERLRGLVPTFPDAPALYAAILRLDTMGAVTVKRDEGDYLLQGNPLPERKEASRNNRPEQLAAFEEAATAGERLDPDNAYFPFMRSIALFAAHRDEEALEAIHLAARKPIWDDYVMDEAEGKLRLIQAAQGDHSALSDTVQLAMLLFPHYAQLRSAARTAAYKAVEAEQEGRAEQGFAIRQDIIRVGSRMRVQAKSFIGNLVGIAITRIATTRPGGIPAVKETQPDTSPEGAKRRSKERLEKFTAYLEKIGRAETARWARAEIEAGERAREIGGLGREKSVFDVGSIARLGLWWMGSLAILANALWMLAFGLLATLLIRRRLVPGRFAGLVFYSLILVSGFLAYQMPVGHNVGAMLDVFGNLSAGGAENHEFRQALPGGMACASTIVPYLMLFFLGMISLICRVPETAGVARGFQKLAVPIACLLLLVYGGLVVGTMRQEQGMKAAHTRLLQHEGRYTASLIGAEWPGEVTENPQDKNTLILP